MNVADYRHRRYFIEQREADGVWIVRDHALTLAEARQSRDRLRENGQPTRIIDLDVPGHHGIVGEA